VAKNKGLLNDEEIAGFKHSAIRDASTLKTFDKLVGLFETVNGGATINRNTMGTSMEMQYGNMPRNEIVRRVAAQLRKARNRAEVDKIYKSIAAIK
jgi:hypothetical protein